MVAKRRSEVFSRIGKAALVELISFDGSPESIYNVGDFPREMLNDDNQSNFTTETTKTIKTSKTLQTQYFELNENSEFLLLDLRSEDEFAAYHIIDAISYPEPLLNRDKFMPELLQFVLKYSDPRKIRRIS